MLFTKFRVFNLDLTMHGYKVLKPSLSAYSVSTLY